MELLNVQVSQNFWSRGPSEFTLLRDQPMASIRPEQLSLKGENEKWGVKVNLKRESHRVSYCISRYLMASSRGVFPWLLTMASLRFFEPTHHLAAPTILLNKKFYIFFLKICFQLESSELKLPTVFLIFTRTSETFESFPPANFFVHSIFPNLHRCVNFLPNL